MKLPLHLYSLVAMTIPTSVEGFSSSYQSVTNTGSVTSAFTRRRTITAPSRRSFSRCNLHSPTRGSMLMYDSTSDPPNDKNKGSSSDHSNNMWSALSSTERWISETLSSFNEAASRGGGAAGNPYARKEVSYVCEVNDESAMVVGGIFRRLREARELGEAHGEAEEGRLRERGPAYSPGTLRQTQVVVIPSSEELNSFPVFDKLVNAINQARRNARDYVTDISLEKLDDKIVGENGERDWVVSVNCAHLHPKFGEKTPDEVLAEMKREDEEGEVDLNLKAYQEKRLLARRSPHPTVVIEVKASPPPDIRETAPSPAAAKEKSDKGDKVTSADVQKLEALFGQPAAFERSIETEDVKAKSGSSDDAFYDAIGKSMGIDEITFVSPMTRAQNWVAENDPSVDASKSTFTASDTKYVDAGYEFVFSNIAMICAKFPTEDGRSTADVNRQYLVMSNFLSSSATSFEKFAAEVMNIIGTIPSLAGKVTVSTLHPEHIRDDKRSPVPILLLQWTD